MVMRMVWWWCRDGQSVAVVVMGWWCTNGHFVAMVVVGGV